MIEDLAGLVAKTRGKSQRMLVVSPTFLDRYGRTHDPGEFPKFNMAAGTDDIFDGEARWTLNKSR